MIQMINFNKKSTSPELKKRDQQTYCYNNFRASFQDAPDLSVAKSEVVD